MPYRPISIRIANHESETFLVRIPQAAVAAWLAERRNLVAAGQSSMRVGHVDIFATATR